jgi:FAD:protein FMN transferase
MTLSRRALFTLDFERPPQALDRLVRVHRTAMACRVEIALPEEDTSFVAAARAALDEADRVEALLTIYREASEVSRINREAAGEAAGAGRAEGVDGEVIALIQKCRALHAATEGAFDITSSPFSRCWGFIRREARIPADAEIEAARALVGMQHIIVEAAARRVRFTRPEVSINFNAIGKGYALDRMAAVVRAHGARQALLSAGGSSVVAIGGRRGGWPIDIRSPLIARARLARLRLRDGALGTSGQGEQFILSDGQRPVRYGHVIDPRTGWPATGVISCSVVTRDCASADALSTAFLVGGIDLARRYCAEHPNTLALITPDDGSETPQVFGRFRGAEVDS